MNLLDAGVQQKTTGHVGCMPRHPRQLPVGGYRCQNEPHPTLPSSAPRAALGLRLALELGLALRAEPVPHSASLAPSARLSTATSHNGSDKSQFSVSASPRTTTNSSRLATIVRVAGVATRL